MEIIYHIIACSVGVNENAFSFTPPSLRNYSEFITEDSEGNECAAAHLLPSGAGYMLAYSQKLGKRQEKRFAMAIA